MPSLAENRRAAWVQAEGLKTFTGMALAEAAGRSYSWVRAAIADWIADGLIEETGDKPLGQVEYRVIEDAPAGTTFGRESRTPEFAMWRTMRRLRTFTPDAVHLEANTDARPLSLGEVQRYCTDLTEAGVIECIRKQRFGKSPPRYRLSGRHGPFPPRLMRVPAIYDPNAQEFRILRKRVRV